MAVLAVLAVARGSASHRLSPIGFPTVGVGVQTLSLHLPGSGADRSVRVWRPNVPDAAAALPVVYFLHGNPGSPGDLDVAAVANQLGHFTYGGGTPFVIAAPDGNGARRDDTEWANATDGADQEETFLLRDVLPAVEGRHPRDATHRAIVGFSMGGYGAANLGLRHPRVFGQIVSIAGYYHVDDPQGVFGGDVHAISANSPDQHPAAARGHRVLLLDGEQEDQSLILGETARFAGLLHAAGVPAAVQYAPGKHDWAFVGDEFRLVARFLAEGWGGTVRGTNPRR